MGDDTAVVNASGKIFRKLYLLAGTIAVVYSLLVACSFAWNSYHEHLEQIGLARKEALAIFNKDLSFRLWATKHGGVYVPATTETPPNPYLSQIPERDLVTPSGKRLTLMNPAYIMKQTMQQYHELYGVKGHITSLNALNPANVPDPWERRALERFNRGEKEVTEVTEVDGKPNLRLMQPLMVQEGCLKCHGAQGYRTGDIRGGMAVSLPLTPYLAIAKKSQQNLAVSHLFIWLLGMTGIGFGFVRMKAAQVDRMGAETALAYQRQLLEAFFENTLSCNAILDREFNFIRVNETYARADEWEVADYWGHNHFEFYPSDVQPIFENVVATKTPYEAIARPFVYAGTPERGVTYWDWTLAPILDTGGEVTSLAFTLRNVTERARAQESLAERAKLAEMTADIGYSLTKPGDLRSMLTACSEALVHHLDAAFARIWTLNAAGDLLELRASAGMYTHIDGAHKLVPVGKFKIGLIAAERKPHITNSVIGDPRVHDQEWAKREGMVAFAGHPLTLEDKLVGVMAMFSRKPLSEVTIKALAQISHEIALGIERKRTEVELRKLSSAIEQSPVSIVITDTRGNIEFVNPKFTQLTGYTAAEAVGRSPRILKSGETPLKVYQQLWCDITSGKVWHGELHNRKKNGDPFMEYATIAPVKNPEGVITNYIAIKEDITERRSLEIQLRQAQKMEAVGTLAGGIAHDFNNILTAIIGFGSLMEMKMTEDDPLHVNITQILTAADRAANLTRSLLAFSRKQSIDVKPEELNRIVTGMEKMLRRLIREDIDLRLSLSEDELAVLADAGQIEQVLLNLTTNARDAMPDGGTIAISTESAELDETFKNTHGYGEPGRYAFITFSDSGAGMDEKTRLRIFEPFFTTKGAGKGTGLGLSVCYGIIKQHNGYILCYSEPGRGTTFRIYLPLNQLATKQQAAAVVKELPVAGGTETILVAEDDAAVRSLTTSLLTEYGYRVIEAQDGEEALAKFGEHRDEIRLCLLDVIMPKKNGGEACEEIRKVRPGSRVLFMSGYQADISGQGGLLPEGAALITKPILPRELLRRVREMLDS